ncbi:MAG: hypothetical protein FJ135_06575 [Deltaproteobacteria bacterium]|nr:hypothetical protein [Deltaproteobacteria bacterium]
MAAQAKPPQVSPGCSHPPCCPCDPQTAEITGAEEALSFADKSASLSPTRLTALKRWAIYFLTFFGIYSASSVCPFCGAPGCPVGAGGAALVGGFFASLMQYGKNVREIFRRFFFPARP